MMDRRAILKGGAALLASGSGMTASSLAGLAAETVMLPFANGERPLVRYPGKRLMIGQTSRPPQLETPFSIFNDSVLTPNDAFFVRYHLADIPYDIDPDTFTLAVKGKVKTELKLSLADVRKLPAVELVAVLQCSGNSRGFVEPRTPGGQLGHGAMGNARWRGVPLKTLLDQAGVEAGAQQVVFGGADGPITDGTPDFAKALDIKHASDGEVMLAWQMNGEDLPLLNGYPLRLVVPGFYGTYWVKHVDEITVLDHAFNGFWMTSAYRIPDNDCACVEPGGPTTPTVPITRLNVRSFITSVEDGGVVKAGVPTLLKGIAFDSGKGIAQVSVSIDNGATWTQAKLGADLGKYSFRDWQLSVTLKPGMHALQVCATNMAGQTQPAKALWNPSGYMRNVIETIHVTAA